MTSVIRVRCPACKNRLRIPPEWLERKIRCKFCARGFRPVLKEKVASSTPESGQQAAPNVVPKSAEPAEVGVFAFDAIGDDEGDMELTALGPRPHGRGRLTSSNRIGVVVVVGALLATALGIGFFAPDLIGRGSKSSSSGSDIAQSPGDKKLTASSSAPKAADPDKDKVAVHFPRRFLAVCVHNYLYANPTSSRGNRTNMPDTLRNFARDKLRVDGDQIYLLTDVSQEKDASVPIKPIVEQTIERFLSTCRKQDRIVLVFVGHAVELEGQAYLAPMEGELKIKDSLIPLQWLYDRLATCPARQKVLIFDVCREDTARGNERPGSGPMSERLDAALANPPAGVQVLTACVRDQFSHEYDFASVGNTNVHGGAFLSLLTQASQSGWSEPKPEESLPIELLANRIHEPLSLVVKMRDKVDQTLRLSGAEPAHPPDSAAYNPSEPMPLRFELPKAAMLMAGGLADPQMVRAIFGEVSLPPIKMPREQERGRPGEDQATLLSRVVPFRADVMKNYEPDYANLRELIDQKEKYPMRVAVIQAVDALDRIAKSGKAELMEEFRGPSTDDVKRSLTLNQKGGPARLELELNDAHEALEKVADQRALETSKRWQANYDFVFAQVKARKAYLYEYNLMLAKVKRDELPPLDPKLHNGYRLASQEKIQSPKEIKDLVSDSKKLLNKVIKEHPGTPWEILAKRDLFRSLGLAWQPANLGQ